MKRLLLILLFAGVAPALALAQASQFKGWAAISSELSTRLAPKNEPLDLGEFLPADDMEDLLGTWSTFGTEHSFRNGMPNALNLMIWQVTLTGFSNAVGGSCHTPRLPFHPRFISTLHKLCAWPAPSAKDESVLTGFWAAVMGYNAEESDYLAWRDFFLREYAGRPAEETISAMTLAITMHPRFLLNR